MAEKQTSPFSARDSFKGYLFQCNYALLECLLKIGEGGVFNISIETLDDVVFEKDGDAKEILQLKHTIKKEYDLTNASASIWKTIRIWCHLTEKNHNSNSTFFLITTGKIATDCAAFYLKENNQRDITKAIDILIDTADSSHNELNEKAYEAFNSLSYDQKIHLFENVILIDSVPTLPDLSVEIRKELYFAAKESLLDSFRDRLEGWWFTRVLKHLNSSDDVICSYEIRNKIDILREQFKEDNLPIDTDIIDFDVQKEMYDDYTFVKQLELINTTNARVFLAVKNYYRAFEHKSRWLREGFITPDELERYEDRLIDEWIVCFERMKERIGNDISEDQKIYFAKALYEWAETNILIPLRPAITEEFVTRGSYQILSDEQRVGWHPDFEKRLRELITQEAGNDE